MARDVTMGSLLERLAGVRGDRPLVEEQAADGGRGDRFTYREAADLVARMAGGIAERIEPGDRVVIAAPNNYRFLLLVLAASRAGGVAVPVNPKMRPAEIDHVIADSGATLVIRQVDEVGTDGPPLSA